ncbi:MAG: hypothetical protein IKV45_01320 [Firmicutes bacterium]|nr:hypothetical protein [Bacillota bacterium]
METRSNRNRTRTTKTNRAKTTQNRPRTKASETQHRQTREAFHTSRVEENRSHRTSAQTAANRRKQAPSNRTSANNRQRTAASARRNRMAEVKNIQLKKQSIKQIAAISLIIAIIIGIICLIVPVVKAHKEIEQNIATVAKLEEKDPGEFLAARVPGGINVTDFEAEQNKIVNMDTSTVSNADLLKRFENAVIVGDSLTKGCTNYNYLNDAIIIAKAGISIRNCDDLIDRAINSAAPAIFICFGANDIGYYGQNVDQYIEEYKGVIQRIQKELPYTVIYVQGILPVADRITGSNQKYLSLYCEEMEKMAKETGTFYFDSGFILKRMPHLYDQDGIHPKIDFYPRWLTYLGDIAGFEE